MLYTSRFVQCRVSALLQCPSPLQFIWLPVKAPAKHLQRTCKALAGWHRQDLLRIRGACSSPNRSVGTGGFKCQLQAPGRSPASFDALVISKDVMEDDDVYNSPFNFSCTLSQGSLRARSLCRGVTALIEMSLQRVKFAFRVTSEHLTHSTRAICVCIFATAKKE